MICGWLTHMTDLEGSGLIGMHWVMCVLLSRRECEFLSHGSWKVKNTVKEDKTQRSSSCQVAVFILSVNVLLAKEIYITITDLNIGERLYFLTGVQGFVVTFAIYYRNLNKEGRTLVFSNMTVFSLWDQITIKKEESAVHQFSFIYAPYI